MPSRKKKPAAPVERVRNDVARKAIENLRAGAVIPPREMAEVVEALVLEIERQDRIFEGLRRRLAYVTDTFGTSSLKLVTDYLKPYR